MPWFKVDDGFHGHPKVVELSLEAVGVWTLAGSWCASYLTDGEIGLKSIQRLGGSQEQANELVYAGLWTEPEPGLFQFKDWGDYQPLKAAVEAEREAARERMKRVRGASAGVKRPPEPSPEVLRVVPDVVRPNIDGTSEEVRPTPSLPFPSQPVPSSSRRSPETKLPEGWKPNDAHRQKAAEKHLDAMMLAEGFRNHAETNDRRARNWDAAFRNWILKATPGTPPQSRNVTPQYSWANS
jgi:hypothetical protein